MDRFRVSGVPVTLKSQSIAVDNFRQNARRGPVRPRDRDDNGGLGEARALASGMRGGRGERPPRSRITWWVAILATLATLMPRLEAQIAHVGAVGAVGALVGRVACPRSWGGAGRRRRLGLS